MNKLLVCAALAAPAVVLAAPTLDQAAMEKARSAAQALNAQGQAKKIAVGVKSGGSTAEVAANPSRAYPVSCLDSPLPVDYNGSGALWHNDPNALQAQIVLFGDPFSADAGERNYAETDTITVFRVACANGYSASLLEIDRPTNMDGHTDRYPTLPGVYVTQGTTQNYPIRYSDDPNTFFANNYPNTPLYSNNVYALERYYLDQTPLDYNQAFTLTINDFATSQNLTAFNMPVYDSSDYPDASKPLPISGHMSAAWTNPDQSGEGILLQVYDVGNGKRVLAYAWFTYDDLGLPFWIYGDDGDSPFTIGARSVTVPTWYFQGGSFDGSLPAGVPAHTWGTATFTFPDCNSLLISYTGDASAVHGPNGSATNHLFQRVAYVNGVGCL